MEVSNFDRQDFIAHKILSPQEEEGSGSGGTEWKKSSPLRTYSKITPPNSTDKSSNNKSRYGRYHKPKLSEDFLSTDKKVSQYLQVDIDNQMHYFKSVPIANKSPFRLSVGESPRGRGRPPKTPNSSSVLNVNSGSPRSGSDLQQAPPPTSTETVEMPGLLLPPPSDDEEDTLHAPSSSHDGQTLQGNDEEEHDEVLNENDWNAGDLAWACIGGYPYWPCAVTKEPGQNIYRKVKILGKGHQEREFIHVRFFNDSGRRSWVAASKVMPFHGLDAFTSLAEDSTTPAMKKKDPKTFKAFDIPVSMVKSWQAAVSEAESLRESPRYERVQYFSSMFPAVSTTPGGDEPPPTTEEKPPPKKRGRKSKVELAALSVSAEVALAASPTTTTPPVDCSRSPHRTPLKKTKLNEKETTSASAAASSPKANFRQHPRYRMTEYHLKRNATPRTGSLSPLPPSAKKMTPDEGAKTPGPIASGGSEEEGLPPTASIGTPSSAVLSTPSGGSPAAATPPSRKRGRPRKKSLPTTQPEELTTSETKIVEETPGPLASGGSEEEGLPPTASIGTPSSAVLSTPSAGSLDTTTAATPPSRKRGRPRKNSLPTTQPEEPMTSETKIVEKTEPDDSSSVVEKTSVVVKKSMTVNLKKNKDPAFEEFFDKNFDRVSSENPNLSEKDIKKFIDKTWRDVKDLKPNGSRSKMSASATAGGGGGLEGEGDSCSDSNTASSRGDSPPPLLPASSSSSARAANSRRGAILFHGVKGDKVCQVCLKNGESGEILKCRGPCGLTYHLECSDKPRYRPIDLKEIRDMKLIGFNNNHLNKKKCVSGRCSLNSPGPSAIIDVEMSSSDLKPPRFVVPQIADVISPKRGRGRPRKCNQQNSSIDVKEEPDDLDYFQFWADRPPVSVLKENDDDFFGFDDNARSRFVNLLRYYKTRVYWPRFSEISPETIAAVNHPELNSDKSKCENDNTVEDSTPSTSAKSDSNIDSVNNDVSSVDLTLPGESAVNDDNTTEQTASCKPVINRGDLIVACESVKNDGSTVDLSLPCESVTNDRNSSELTSCKSVKNDGSTVGLSLPCESVTNDSNTTEQTSACESVKNEDSTVDLTLPCESVKNDSSTTEQKSSCESVKNDVSTVDLKLPYEPAKNDGNTPEPKASDQFLKNGDTVHHTLACNSVKNSNLAIPSESVTNNGSAEKDNVQCKSIKNDNTLTETVKCESLKTDEAIIPLVENGNAVEDTKMPCIGQNNIPKMTAVNDIVVKMEVEETPSVEANQKGIETPPLSTDGSESVEIKEEDISLKPLDPEAKSKWMCSVCASGGLGPCFVCGEDDSSSEKVKCDNCKKAYHETCRAKWPQGQRSLSSKGRATYHCPQHACHTCVSDNPASLSTRFSNDKLVRCLRCPATYHHGNFCIPAGSAILSSSQILCPRHYKHSKKIVSHVSTNWCMLCAKGGDLICCDLCPNSFHLPCLNLEETPDGSFLCEDCVTGRYPLFGEIVWVKLGTYRWWPARILFPQEIPNNILQLPHSPGEFAVEFYGSHDYYWVNRGRCFIYQEGDGCVQKLSKKRTDKLFAKGVDEAQVAFAKWTEERANREANARPTLKPPKYVKIAANKMVGSVPKTGETLDREAFTHTCNCDPNKPNPCGPDSDCINRMLSVECDPEVCPAKTNCCNRNFELKCYPRLEPFKTATRGWGLKTLDPIRKGSFIIEYVGEVIDEEEYKKRLAIMLLNKDENFYFLTIDKDRMIDAGPKGNVARFMNHSCDPNCETQKWTVNGDTRIGLFAVENIEPGTELVFNYNLATIGNTKVECKCDSANCSGFIGVKNSKGKPSKGVPVLLEEKKAVLKKKVRRRLSKAVTTGEKSTTAVAPEVTPTTADRSSSSPAAVVGGGEKEAATSCFTCGSSGGPPLLHCHQASCPKAYHLSCLGLTKLPPGGWVCPRHQCSVCSATRVEHCSRCINSYCAEHAAGNISLHRTHGLICFSHNLSDSGSDISSDETSDHEETSDQPPPPPPLASTAK